MAKVGINGFGRIGRLFLRAALEKKLNVAAINHPNKTPEYLAYLFKHDSVHGRFDGDVCTENGTLVICDKKICVFNESDPKKIPWKQADVDYVVDCSGKYKTMDTAKQLLTGGAKKVLVSAPSKDIPMYVPGVNMCCYKASETIVSMASCTTNCVAPLAKVVHDNFGIEESLMTTIHSVTRSQSIIDGSNEKNWRLGRSGMENIIPSTTGAAAAVGMVIPDLKGKITGLAFRVPVPNVSVVDLTVKFSQATDYDTVKCVIREAAEDEMRGILCYTEEDVVSTDIIGSGCSSIFDAKAGIALNSCFMKLIAWYDNEFGYANRLVDMVTYMFQKDCEAKKKENPCGVKGKGGAPPKMVPTPMACAPAVKTSTLVYPGPRLYLSTAPKIQASPTCSHAPASPALPPKSATLPTTVPSSISPQTPPQPSVPSLECPASSPRAAGSPKTDLVTRSSTHNTTSSTVSSGGFGSILQHPSLASVDKK